MFVLQRWRSSSTSILSSREALPDLGAMGDCVDHVESRFRPCPCPIPDTMCAVALRRSPRGTWISSPPSGGKTSFPAGFIEPCDPTLSERAPSGEDWLYEIKADGYRAQVHLRGGK